MLLTCAECGLWGLETNTTGLAHSLVLLYTKTTHSLDGMGDAGLPDAVDRHVETEHAALAMIRLCTQNPGEVTLVCLGPLTTVALACRLDESFPSKVKDVVIMGGTIRSKGNVTLTGEFNWHKDPEAAHIVLSSFAKSTMVRIYI